MVSYIVAIRSRTQVMRLFSFLRENNVCCRVVNTPREVSIGCGISIEVTAEEYSRAKTLVEPCAYDTFIGWFRCERMGRRLIVTQA